MDETDTRAWIALDIGGANLKIADGRGFAKVVRFELWRRTVELEAMLTTMLSECPHYDCVAVTMTGELADCYHTKADGVRHIVGAVSSAADGQTVQVYLTEGKFVSAEAACEFPLLAAASNWHALASFCSQLVEGRNGLLIDMGSTTTDIIPFTPVGPLTKGKTDPERLVAGELVYTGVQRSPVCSLVDTLPWRGERCPLAQEVFATTVDAYLTLGDIPENLANGHTADGRPWSKEAARDRLARSICADRTIFSEDDANRAAEAIREQQITLLEKSLDQVGTRSKSPEVIVIGGIGEFLLKRLLDRLALSRNVISLNEELGSELSECGPAHALAVIARMGGAL